MKIILIALLLLPFAAVAAPILSPEDTIYVFLRFIFGGAVDFMIGEPVPSPTNPDSLVGTLMLSYNILMSGLLTLMTVINGSIAFSELTFKSELNTNKYDTFSHPAQVLLAFVFLIPASGGYSVIQMLGFYGLGYSTKYANELAIKGTEYMTRGGNLISMPLPFSPEHILMHMLEMKVCALGVNTLKNSPSAIESEKTIDELPVIGSYTKKLEFNGVVDESFSVFNLNKKPRTCGYIEIQSTNAVDEESNPGNWQDASFYLNTISKTTIETLSYNNELDQLAKQIVNHSLSPYSGANTAKPDPTLFMIALQKFRRNLIEAKDGFLEESRQNSDTESFLNCNKDEFCVKNNGYFWLGSLYWNFNNQTRKNMNIVNTVTPTASNSISAELYEDTEELPLVFGGLYQYLNFDRQVNLGTEVVLASELLESNSRLYSPSEGVKFLILESGMTDEDFEKAEAESNASILKGQTSRLMSSTYESVIGDVGAAIGLMGTYSVDPIRNVVVAGSSLLTVAGTIKALEILAKTISLNTEDLKKKVESLSLATGPLGFFIGTAVTTILNTIIIMALEISKTLTFAFMALVTVGSYMVYFVPFIPIVKWATKIFTHLIAVFELIVLAPAHAVVHATLESKGIIPQRAQTGWTMWVSAIATGPLMVIGFFGAMVMLYIAGFIFNMLIPSFVDMYSDIGTYNGGEGVNMYTDLIVYFVGLIAIVVISLNLLVSFIVRSTGLISEIPDRGARIIGGAIESFGDDGVLQDNKGGAQGNLQYAGGMLSPDKKEQESANGFNGPSFQGGDTGFTYDNSNDTNRQA